MALKSPHSEWKLEQINPIQVRAVGLDQLMTNLWLTAIYGSRPLVRMSNVYDTVAQVAGLMERRGDERFAGFADAPGAAETWLRADLLRIMKKRPEQFSVARPLHALAVRLRGPQRLSNDSDASLLVYDWLHAADPDLIVELQSFIDVQADTENLDLASVALAYLGETEDPDRPRPGAQDSPRTPLCLGHAKRYCDDLRALLAYRTVMPRTVLVDHIRALTGFHLGLYLLRTFQIVTDAEQSGGHRMCDSCAAGRPPEGRCPHRLDLLVDLGEDARSPLAKLAEQSWTRQEDVLGRYVRSHLTLKKLHEFAADQAARHPDEAVPHATLEEIAAIERRSRADRLDPYFDSRLDEMRRSSGDTGERIAELEREYRKLGLSSFRSYVAVLAYFSEGRWLSYHRQLLDSLFNKNSAEGALRQPLGGRRRRRMALGPSLLETLTLIAVTERHGGRYATRPLRIDQLIGTLEADYDILISQAPAHLANDPQTLTMLASNVGRLKARLREIGLFTDLSDAFLAQTVRPRFRLDEQ